MRSRRFQRGGQPTVSFFAFQDIITAVGGILVIITLLLSLHLEKVPVSTDDESASPELKAELDARLAELAGERAAAEKMLSAHATGDPASLEAEIARLRQQLVAAASRRSQQDEVASSVKSNRSGDALEVEAEAVRRKIQANAERLAELERRSMESAAAMMELEREVKERQAALLAEQQRRNDLWLIPQKSGTSKEPVLVLVENDDVELQRFGQAAKRIKATSDFTEALGGYSKLDDYLVFYFKPSGAARFKELRGAAREAGFEIGYDAIDEDANLHFGPRPIDLRK